MINPFALLSAVMTGIAALFFWLYQSEVDDHATFRAHTEAASRVADAANLARLSEQTRKTAEIQADYAALAGRLDREFSSRLNRLRGKTAACQTLPGSPPAAAGVDDSAAQPVPGAGGFEAACLDMERAAAGDAHQLIWLQHWITTTRGAP